MDLVAGTKLAHYEIRSRIGAGGMGEVYLAHDTKLDRKVALKILPAKVASNQDRMARFVREAKSAAALNHPNIATIHETGESEGTNFIAMEYIDGRTLGDEIHRQQTELIKLLRYLQHTAEGLAKAHAAGIIHRDLKPDNIMITRDGHAKILDFGLAKLIEPEAMPGVSSEVATAVMPQHSTPGTVIGTIGYMSPEQAQGKSKEIDQRSDVFSFGCILYEAVTGQKAFPGKDAIDTLNKIIRVEPVPISDYWPEAPNDLQRVVRRCLEKDPEDRYQSIKDVAIELRNLRREIREAGVETTTPPARSDAVTSGGSDSLPTRASSAEFIISGIRQHRVAAVLALVVLVGVAIALGFFLRARNSEVAIDSIAVMPFQNADGDASNEYLCDGISEALINSLTELQQLRVIARATSFSYKNKQIDPLQLGRKLSVRSVLTGWVRQAGDNLTVQVDLIDATTGAQLWGHQYARKTSDVLSVKQAIAEDVADKLRLRLSGNQQRQLTRRDTKNPESFQFYLRGRYRWNKRTDDELKRAIGEFQQAIDRDPSFALGYVGIADCYVALEHYGGKASSEIIPKARAALDRALAIDNSLPEAYASSASIYQRQWRWNETEEEIRRAIALNPNYPSAHHFYAYYLYVKRQFDDAKREIKRAHELDPLSPVISENLSMVSLLKGDVNAAIEEGRRTIEIDPNFADSHYVLGFAYLRGGRNGEAEAEFQRAVDISHRAGTYLGNLGFCYAITGRHTEAQAVIKELEEKYAKGESSGLFIAGVFAGLGDKEKSLAWLEKDFQQRSDQLPTIAWRPQFEGLRTDARYADLLGRMGLQP